MLAFPFPCANVCAFARSRVHVFAQTAYSFRFRDCLQCLCNSCSIIENIIITDRLLLTSDVFNYEQQSSFVLEFTVSDGFAETGPYVLNIDVNDVNEPCVFSPQYYYIQMSEGNVSIYMLYIFYKPLTEKYV